MKPTDYTWKIESKRNFFKYWFNKHPDLMIMAGLCMIAAVPCFYSIKKFQDTAPFEYRYRYTIWRDDDPRALKMMSRMENFKPLRRID